jgi:Zn-finger nucleic acid-binding protein
MTNSWDDMKRAKEGDYFERKNKEALNRLQTKLKESQPRLSPASGEPMEQVVLHGVVVDRCKDSGGIWLDPGELEHMLEVMKSEETDTEGWIHAFMKGVRSLTK